MGLRIHSLAALLALLCACGSPSLRPDAVPIDALHAGYPSAEFSACGKVWNGLGFCSLKKGEDLTPLKIFVKGHYTGTVQFKTTCLIDAPSYDAIHYENSDVVSPYIGSPDKSCGISFVVSPEFPDEKNSGLIINSFEGHLYIRVLDGISWMGLYSKTKEENDLSFIVPFESQKESASVIFISDLCDTHYYGDLPVENNQVRINLGKTGNKLCLFNGAVYDGAQTLRVSALVAGYRKDFLPLSIPSVKQDEEYLTVRGDENISVISLDNESRVSSLAKFKFAPNESHILRLLTVKGRSIVGVYDPEKGFTWIP